MATNDLVMTPDTQLAYVLDETETHVRVAIANTQTTARYAKEPPALTPVAPATVIEGARDSAARANAALEDVRRERAEAAKRARQEG